MTTTSKPHGVAIVVRDLQVRAGQRTLLDAPSLELAADSVTALLGPSGAGKTTLLRVLAGLTAPDRGEVTFDGEVVSAQGDIRRAPGLRAVGYLPQDLGLWDHLRVIAHLQLVLAVAQPSASRRALRDEAMQWLDRLQLAPLARRRAGTLSGGERRRLALGRALATNPRLLLLDEAFTGLDYGLRDEMVAAVESWRAGHACTVVIVSHLREDTVQLAQQAVVVESGRIVERGPLDAMLRDPQSDFGKRFARGHEAS
ncbi:MAG: ATP-binding cassette domain-containing protein [Planctomycetota bacterium]